jgi:hypothetical protein
LILYLFQIAALTRGRAADRGGRGQIKIRRHAFVDSANSRRQTVRAGVNEDETGGIAAHIVT